jgi:hypothetical protein
VVAVSRPAQVRRAPDVHRGVPREEVAAVDLQQAVDLWSAYIFDQAGNNGMSGPIGVATTEA